MPLMQVMGSNGVIDQTDFVNPSPKVETYDPSLEFDHITPLRSQATPLVSEATPGKTDEEVFLHRVVVSKTKTL